jgi:hypothetical protein
MADSVTTNNKTPEDMMDNTNNPGKLLLEQASPTSGNEHQDHETSTNDETDDSYTE